MRPSTLRHPARVAGASLLRLQSDERLAALAVAGHEAAFDAVVDRYRTPLTRYCAGIVGPSRAEDAVQQALINAHDALKRTDEVRHLRSWLYRIAHNAALNVLRAVRDDVSLDEAAGAIAAADDGPAATFERSERFTAMVAALQELPERQRAALVLRELEGRSHEEIADALGVSAGSARQHLMRARTAMRGAVTAITPYPLIVRLAETLASPGAAGWGDAAVGAGAGATLAKLTAGIVATGALVGGAVGTERVVHHHGVAASVEHSPGAAVRSAAKSPLVRGATIGLPLGGAGSGGASTGGGPAGHGGGGGGASGRKGDDDRGSSADGKDPGDDGSGGGRGPGSGGDEDRSGRGSSGSGSGDSSGGGEGGGSGESSGKGSGDDRSGGSSGKGSGSDGSGNSGSSGKGSGGDSSGSGSSSSGSSGSRSSSSGSSGSSGTSSGGSGSSDSGSSTSHGGRQVAGDTSESGSDGGSGDDSSGTSSAAVTTPTTTTPTTTVTTITSSSGSSGSGSSGGDGSSGGKGSGSSGSGSGDD